MKSQPVIVTRKFDWNPRPAKGKLRPQRRDLMTGCPLAGKQLVVAEEVKTVPATVYLVLAMICYGRCMFANCPVRFVRILERLDDGSDYAHRDEDADERSESDDGPKPNRIDLGFVEFNFSSHITSKPNLNCSV